MEQKQIITSKDKIKIISEDLNGDHGYTNEKAQFGYIKSEEYLFVPKEVENKLQTFTSPQQHVVLSTKEILHMMYANFNSLTGANYSPEKAIRISFLRAKWVELGCLLRTKNDRHTPFDEVNYFSYPTIFDLIDPDGEVVVDEEGRLIEEGETSVFARAFNALNVEAWNPLATLLWSVAAHVFRVRGHHYKEGFDELFDRTWKGTTLELPDKFCNWKDICRTAIHPFGVAALSRSFEYFLAKDGLTTNLILRADAIPCGAAIVGTTYAAILQFQSTPFWKDFYKQYKPQIEQLNIDYNTVKEGGLKYHISARLYGYTPEIVPKDAAQMLAPAMMGYIHATPRGSAIKQQRALVISAENNPMMSELLKNWLQNQLEKAADKPTLAEALGASRARDL